MGGGLIPLKLAERIPMVMEGNQIPGANIDFIYRYLFF